LRNAQNNPSLELLLQIMHDIAMGMWSLALDGIVHRFVFLFLFVFFFNKTNTNKTKQNNQTQTQTSKHDIKKWK